MQQKFEAEILQTLVEVQDQTMQSIATELHDNVGQLLSLTTLTLNSVDLSNTEKTRKKIENSLSSDIVRISEKRFPDSWKACVLKRKVTKIYIKSYFYDFSLQYPGFP